jgi:hypothetical protein
LGRNRPCGSFVTSRASIALTAPLQQCSEPGVASVCSDNVVQKSGARLTHSAPTPTQIVVLLAAVFALAWQINEPETEEDGVSGARRADDDEHQSDSSGETANRDQDDAPDEHHSAEDRLDGCGACVPGRSRPASAFVHALGFGRSTDLPQPRINMPEAFDRNLHRTDRHGRVG